MYKSVVLAPYSEQGIYPGLNPEALNAGSCDGVDALNMAVGDEVSIKMTGWSDGTSCRPAIGTLLKVPQTVKIIGPAKSNSSTNTLLEGISLIAIEGCKGLYSLGYYRTSERIDPYTVPVQGQQPAIVLLRRFMLTEGTNSACKSCEDFFAVQLERPL